MDSSKVTITFEGILLFCFKNKVCQVGINNLDDNHTFSIEVNTNSANITRPQPIPFPTMSASELTDSEPFRIEVYNTNHERIDNAYADDQSFTKDVLNIEGKKFANGKLEFKRDMKIPSIFVSQGKFLTKNDDLTPPDDYRRSEYPNIIRRFQQNRPDGLGLAELLFLEAGGIVKDLPPFATVIHAEFELQPDHCLFIKYGSRETHFQAGEVENIEITVKNVDLDSRGGREESRHFLNHYEFFKMEDRKKYGLVLFEKELVEGEYQVKCRNDGCNSVWLNETESLPTFE